MVTSKHMAQKLPNILNMLDYLHRQAPSAPHPITSFHSDLRNLLPFSVLFNQVFMSQAKILDQPPVLLFPLPFYGSDLHTTYQEKPCPQGWAGQCCTVWSPLGIGAILTSLYQLIPAAA